MSFTADKLAAAAGKTVHVDASALTNDSANVILDIGTSAGIIKVTGGAGPDNIDFTGGSAANIANVGGGQNTVVGGSGNDTITSGDTKSSLSGANGDDTITAGSGNDTIGGGAGNDTISAGAGDDSVTGGGGADYISFSSEANYGDRLVISAQTDSYILKAQATDALAVANMDTISGFDFSNAGLALGYAADIIELPVKSSTKCFGRYYRSKHGTQCADCRG